MGKQPKRLLEKALAFSSLNCKATWKQVGRLTEQEEEQAKRPVRSILYKDLQPEAQGA